MDIAPHELKFLKNCIPTLQKAISSTFKTEDWKEFGYQSETSDLLNGHRRLYSSLHFGDDDYDGIIFHILEEFVDNNPKALMLLVENKKIKAWIEKYKPNDYNKIYDVNLVIPQFQAEKISPKKIVNDALQDADDMIASGKPENAVDRMHVAFHGYLKEVCDLHKIGYSSNAAITELFKAIYSNLIKIDKSISHPKEVEKILKGYASSIDAINQLRNHASMAHVNDLLGKDEALLFNNSVRVILHYLESKISS